MDKIFLSDLEVQCLIGIADWERQVPQTVRIDLEVEIDSRGAAAGDSIAAATDYKRLAKSVIRVVRDSHFQLLESLAEEVARTCLGEPGVSWVSVRVSKPGAIRGSRDVGVAIERGVPSRGGDAVIYLGIGSNVDPEVHVPATVDWLRRRFAVTAVSPVYAAPPSGPAGQPPFLNLVVECRTGLDPFGVWSEARGIEDRLGRVRSQDPYSPRTCDIDLLLHGDLVGEHWGVSLPHPQLLEEPFVFVPLLDVAPDIVDPASGQRVAELVTKRRRGHGLRRREDLGGDSAR